MRQREAERGISLVLALWALALLAFLAVVISQSSGRLARHITLDRDVAAADAVASAGINLAILDLMAGREDSGWRRRFPLGGAVHHCRFADDATLSITTEDDAGKVDLNTASERLLIALIAGTGGDLGRARRLAAAIVDFRDADSIKRPDGAEAADYRDAGLAWEPKNAPFEAIEELRLVLGITREDLLLLAPHITLHSGITGVDPSAISAATKAVITKGSAELGLPTSGGERVPPVFAAVSSKRVFTVRAEARTAGVVFHRVAVIRLGEDRNSYSVRAWRRADQPLLPTADVPPSETLPPC